MQCIHNPPAKWLRILSFIIILWVVILSLLFYMIGSTLFALLVPLFGLTAFIILALHPLLFRPKSITITDDGIILNLSLNRHRTVKWNEIVEIYTIEGSPLTVIGRMRRAGGIVQKSMAPIDLTYELALKVKDEYYMKNGDCVYSIWRNRK